ncbi:MAG: NAD(P)H-hydrate epimerase [Microbacterium sp. 71-36]|uniref:NAD(P)H-hydrate epimerase n=1 Tax=unclassified Microbacterium TaxID=2609290 RepID=UPI00086DD6E9|nr:MULTISPECIES: NAD(P)H-hydrate epimerase [unclassified Microbacterium]MBN9212286.1 NAD(P)H-hydrate epimerase [Microbacterium sp.]ODT38649.1 MAG: NAD(P)H-hydrate epimerase [Microbacterium sp. SCN 71-17]OJV75723.1 MAG: NAD(P)H-hydrate epimerase [Microbacterium sp. 71-36]
MTERTVAYTADAIRAAEAPLLAAGRPLMREAARALAEVVADELARTPGPVLVLAGSGDNGGDALYAAADIAGAGTRVDVVLTRDRVHRDALDAAVAAGAGLRDASDICGAHSDHVLVVDGILGIGASSDSRLRGTARAVVEALLPVVASERVRVVAVDVPSGLHPDSGEADAAVLPAATTVTFGAVKAGLLRGHGPRLSGRLVLVDLGLEPQLRRVHPAVTAAVPVVRRAPAPWA